MDEKTLVQQFIKLRKEWAFYMETGNTTRAAEAFKKMVDLGNKYPSIAKYINTSRLGVAMTEAGFVGAEVTGAVSVAEGAVAAEAVAGGGGTIEAVGAGAATAVETTVAGGAGITVGWVIAVALIVGALVYLGYLAYKKHKQQTEHKNFVNHARRCLSPRNLRITPIPGTI